MPDAHVGLGATVGSVIPTKEAIIPSAVGVDIGCGMIAVETNLGAADLPDSLDPLMPKLERAVPAGVGKGRLYPSSRGATWLRKHKPHTSLDQRLGRKALDQLGSLGSGNHFLEVCLDERDTVWLVLHSGSRGVGNILATQHIKKAKADMKRALTSLEDPDLAWFVQGTPEFEAYVTEPAPAGRSRWLCGLVGLVLLTVVVFPPAWGEVVEARVEPSGVVTVGPGEDRSAGAGAVIEPVAVDQLALE